MRLPELETVQFTPAGALKLKKTLSADQSTAAAPELPQRTVVPEGRGS